MAYRFIKINFLMILVTQISWAGAEVQPQLEQEIACQALPKPAGQEGYSQQQYDPPGCDRVNAGIRGRNAAKQQALANSRNDAKDILAEPTQPTCTVGSGQEYNFACTSEWAEYNRKKQIYDLAKDTANNSGGAAGSGASNQPADNSVTGTLAHVEAENNRGKVIYSGIGGGLAAMSAVKFSECTGQNYSACIQGAAFAIASALAFKQATNHSQTEMEACNTFNRLSSAQKNCQVDSGPNGSTVPLQPPKPEDIFTPDGQCKPGVQACAAANGSSSANGATIAKPVLNCPPGRVNCLASLPSVQSLAAKGKMKLPNGREIDTSQLMNKKGLMDTGLSAAEADKVLADMNAAQKGLSAKAVADLKNKDLADGKKYTGEYSTLSGGSGSGGGLAHHSNSKYQDKVSEAGSRSPSSEGLVRDFKGDLIGAAGDDIFTMMNRRYKLKAEQDTFISP